MRQQLRRVRPADDREGIGARYFHSDIRRVIDYSPTSRRGARQKTLYDRGDAWAVITGLRDRNCVGRGTNLNLQGVVYPRLDGWNYQRKPQIIDATSVRTTFNGQRLR